MTMCELLRPRFDSCYIHKLKESFTSSYEFERDRLLDGGPRPERGEGTQCRAGLRSAGERGERETSNSQRARNVLLRPGLPASGGDAARTAVSRL